MSAFSAAAVVEELVDATSTLREENEALRQALLKAASSDSARTTSRTAMSGEL